MFQLPLSEQDPHVPSHGSVGATPHVLVGIRSVDY